MGKFGIKIEQRGDFSKLETFIAKTLHDDLYRILDEYGKIGVTALAAATPEESGLTASRWSYYVDRNIGSSSITWTNDHMDDNGGTPVIILLQYGHGTGTGGYVQGRDFINPAISRVFDQIADAVWKEVVAR